MPRKQKSDMRESVTKDLISEVIILMDNRRRLLAPFPIAAEQIYRLVWTPEERAAILVLARRQELFHEGRRIYIDDLAVNGQIATAYVNLRRSLPMPGYAARISASSLPDEFLGSIGKWAAQWCELRSEQDRLLNKIRSVANICRTYGQLYRLWPDLLSLFDQRGQIKVRRMKARSPYPPEALGYRYDNNGNPHQELIPEYRPEAFAPFTAMIAECLMLPKGDTFEVGILDP